MRKVDKVIQVTGVVFVWFAGLLFSSVLLYGSYKILMWP
jgi:hypothetical protein